MQSEDRRRIGECFTTVGSEILKLKISSKHCLIFTSFHQQITKTDRKNQLQPES